MNHLILKRQRQSRFRSYRAHDVRFSVIVKLLPPIREVIEAICEHAWSAIPYWREGGPGVAETTYTAGPGVAETTYTAGPGVAETIYSAFTATPDEVELRLIFRRVRPTPGSQLALDAVLDDHNARSPTHKGHAPRHSWPSTPSSTTTRF
ncbi:MAG: hypothetical protein BRC32_05880 [Actinobacteria bacterium QS_8_72_14]|nr:MAG: hypothetical protein BRC32_05880 [Actinobacteria bacterium QS_8_72_14]